MPAAPLPGEEREQVRKEEKAEIVKLKGKIKKSENRLTQLTQERESLLEEIRRNPFHHSRHRNERLKELAVLVEKEEANWLDLQTIVESLAKNLLISDRSAKRNCCEL